MVQVIWYNSSDAKGPAPSNTWDPPSGAYMFRPNGLFTTTAPVRMQVMEGPVVTEIRQARTIPSQAHQAATSRSLRAYLARASAVKPNLPSMRLYEVPAWWGIPACKALLRRVAPSVEFRSHDCRGIRDPMLR